MSAGPRIILADDDIGVRNLVRRILTTELGVDVVEASDGLGVLEALKTGDFDMAILDIEMGILDGVDTLEAIRATKDFRNLPVIVISGRADAANVARLKQWNVKAVLAKPLSVPIIRNRLLPIIRQIVESRLSLSTETVSTPIELRPSSRVFVVGSDQGFTEFVRASLEGCCALAFHRDESAAVRAALTKSPQVVLLAPSDPVLSPTIFAKAMHCGITRTESRLIVYREAGASRHQDDARFTRLEALTPGALMGVLKTHLTASGLSLAALHISGAETFYEWSRGRVAATLGQPARVVHPPGLCTHLEELAVEVSHPIVVGGLRWRATVVLTRAFAIRHAACLSRCDIDLVSEDAAIHAAEAVGEEVVQRLGTLWARYGLVSRTGSPEARSMRWWESRVTPDAAGAFLWRLSSGAIGAEVAAFGIVPGE